MQYPTLNTLDIQGKKALLRAGFDVPISDGKVTDTTRIESNVDTMRYALDQGASLILIAHQGRPNGQPVPEMSQQPLVPVLEQLLSTRVDFANDILSDDTAKKVDALKKGEVLLLENVRFYAGEESKNAEERDTFGKTLASFADVYINDAFTNCHRNHASMTSVPKYLPSAMGLNTEKEVRGLSKVTDHPERPVTLVISGAKSETKVPVIEGFLSHGDAILVGGCVANTLMASSGIDMQGSKYDEDFVELGKQLILHDTVHIPTDVVKNDNNAALDIGQKTVEQYKEIIAASRTIVWNGPLGLFEDKRYAEGTKHICDAIISATQKGANSILGGGDTLAFLSAYGYETHQFTYVSTAGGAMLDFISGKKLPALEALLLYTSE